MKRALRSILRPLVGAICLSLSHYQPASAQQFELRSMPFGKLPSHKMELIDFTIRMDSFQLKFRDKTEFWYIEGTDENFISHSHTLPEAGKRSDILWDGPIAGKRVVVTEAYEGLGQRVINFTDPENQENIRLFNANRSQGIFPRISFERTDSSLLIWYRDKGERDNPNSILYFYEIGTEGDQIRFWQVELPFDYELTELYRVQRAGSSIIFALKIYRISPIDKRGGQVNYRWQIAFNPIGESQLKLLELEKEDQFTGTPLILFTDSSLTLFRTRSYQKAGWQREVECVVFDLASGEQFKLIAQLDSLNIPKNAFTYSRRARSYVNFLPIRLETNSKGLTALLEYRHIELEGRRGNEPLYSYFLGPLLVVDINLETREINGLTIEKYQYSQGDDAIYSGAFIRDLELGKTEFFYSSRLGSFLGVRFTLPIHRKAHLFRSVLQEDGSQIQHYKIETDRSRYAPVWRYAVEKDGVLYVPMRRGKEIRVGRVELVSKP